MGYFSNGTAGEIYQKQWCSRCIHYDECPIWTAHLLHNYRDCNDKESILHMLIPRDGISNLRCEMFREADPKLGI